MKPAVWFRIAAGLLLLFAIGHTFGFLTFRPATPEGQAVWQAMNNTRLVVGEPSLTYGGFYIGFGLFVSASMLLFAWIAWTCGTRARRNDPQVVSLAWGMVGFECLSAIVCLRYFSWIQVLFPILTAVCLALGSVRLRTAPAEIS